MNKPRSDCFSVLVYNINFTEIKTRSSELQTGI